MADVSRLSPRAQQTRIALIDGFERDIPFGKVIGAETDAGIVRKGIDIEGVIAVDNSALRIQPLVNPGWARSGIAYGPYLRRNGLAFSVTLVNGHNISHSEPLPDGLKARLWRWSIGTEADRRSERLRNWLRAGDKRAMWRRVKQWARTGTRFLQLPIIDENLAVGWFPTEAPVDPLKQGSGLIVHAVVPSGGELWARHGQTVMRSHGGLQNLPFHYTVVLRERGAAFYAASAIACAPGLPTYPRMRLLAIDPFGSDETVYAGVHQSVLGEIGFRADTRIYQTLVADIPAFQQWYGSAVVADRLVGDGPLDGSAAAIGRSCWRRVKGEYSRTAQGLVSSDRETASTIDAGEPVGLVHLLVDVADRTTGTVSVIWRFKDVDNCWTLTVGSSECRLSMRDNGRTVLLPAVTAAVLLPNATNSIQVYDDGARFRLYVNSHLAYDSTFNDSRFAEATQVGFASTDSPTMRIRDFEAHPREVDMSHGGMLKDKWPAPRAGRVAIEDPLRASNPELAGRMTPLGGQTWERVIGSGVFSLTPEGAQVAASPAAPCPGRTAYTVDWDNHGYADLEVTVTPPGLRKWAGERGRGGIMLWQDADNYITISAFIGDWPAMSMAAFFKLEGFEELYDAVWTNVGNRMHWGLPHRLQVVFDRDTFIVRIDREPVLYRALRDVYPRARPFHVRKVGLVANWEWGNDTGTRFSDFVARDAT